MTKRKESAPREVYVVVCRDEGAFAFDPTPEGAAAHDNGEGCDTVVRYVREDLATVIPKRATLEAAIEEAATRYGTSSAVADAVLRALRPKPARKGGRRGPK